MRRRVAATRRLHGLRTGHAARATAAGDPEPGDPARPARAAASRPFPDHTGALQAGPAGRIGTRRADPDADAHPPTGAGLRPEATCPHPCPGSAASGERRSARLEARRLSPRSWRTRRPRPATDHLPGSARDDRQPQQHRVAGGRSPCSGADSHRHHACVAPDEHALESGRGPPGSVLTRRACVRRTRPSPATHGKRPADTRHAGPVSAGHAPLPTGNAPGRPERSRTRAADIQRSRRQPGSRRSRQTSRCRREDRRRFIVPGDAAEPGSSIPGDDVAGARRQRARHVPGWPRRRPRCEGTRRCRAARGRPGHTSVPGHDAGPPLS